MKKLLSILLISLLVNCSTFTVVDEDLEAPVPKINSACSTYEGTAWEKCVIKLFGNYGKIITVPPKKTLKNKERENEKYVIYNYELCLGEGTFCLDDPDRKYDPTTWSQIRPHLITASGFLFLGFIGGASARQ